MYRLLFRLPFRMMLAFGGALFPLLLLGQGEADHWAWGYNNMIDFGSGAPIVSAIGGHDLSEGNATISDPCGNLLFYTDGDSVWDQNHNPMVGGFGLNGVFLSMIQNLIVPHPGNSDLFYIIYVGRVTPLSTFNIFYATVDMSLQGGLGEVTQKLQLFHASRTPWIAGVKHANGIDTWVSLIDYPTDTIFSYLFTSTGIHANPVKSYLGPILGPQLFNLGQGQAKFSPDGQHFAISLFNDQEINLMDFDPTTGQFSNLISIPQVNFASPGIVGPGGLEFSPNSQYLYWGFRHPSGFFGLNDSVYQADISGPNLGSILSSIQNIGHTNSPIGLLRLQLSNQGKIYANRDGLVLSLNDRLDAINFPNASGIASNYQTEAVQLNGITREYTPSFLAHFLRPWEVDIGSVDTTGTPPCTGDTLPFALSYYNQIDSILWDFGDGSGMVSALQTDHSYGSAGSFPVSAVVYRGCPNPDTLRDTVEILPLPLADLGMDTTLCEGLTLQLDAGAQPQVSFLWSDGSQGQTLLADTTGWVWLEASNACLSTRDSLYLNYDSLSVLNLGPSDTLLCPGQGLLLDASISGGSYRWQDGSMGNSFAVPGTQPGNAAQLYWVEARNACDTLRDSLSVQVESLPTVALGADTSLCEGDSLLLDGTFTGLGNSTYLWQDGSSNAQLLVQAALLPASPQTFWIEVANLCGTARDSIVIDPILRPQVDLGPDPSLCEQDSLLLDATFADAQSYLWQDGSTLPTLTVQGNAAGTIQTFWVELQNTCGSARDSLDVEMLARPQADLGADTILCDQASYALDLNQANATFLWQDGNTSPSYTLEAAAITQNPTLFWVAVSNAACTERDSLFVSRQLSPTVDLGPPDTLLCDNATWELDASFPDATYRWQDGSTNPTYLLNPNLPNTLFTVEVRNFCGTAQDLIEVNYGSTPIIDLGADTTLCEGEALLLDASYPNATYLWQDGSTDPTILADQPITYTALVTALCGDNDDHITLSFFPPPIVELGLGVDTLVCEDTELRFDLSDLAGTYLWSDGSTLPTFATLEAGLVSVLVENGCTTASDSLFVRRENCDCPLYLPTAFTPNNDGHNDVFRIGYDCNFLSYELQIFNRWGRLVFVSNDPSAAWDGSVNGIAQAEGVFSYVIRYRFRGLNGNREAELDRQRAGTVMVWR